ncbi:MAG TPA: elongation factor 1-beta [Nitrososphaerales archaeon]|nr:elongation factor 1-beta [Nitrososphaerales archaeon]
MGSYVIRMKVLPEDPSTNLEEMVIGIGGLLPKPAMIRGHKVEPIAFGLSAIIMDVIAPEEEGMIDRVEEIVSKAPHVSQYEVIAVSRMSARLPPK